MVNASRKILRDIFDCPTRRSMNTIGISSTRKPGLQRPVFHLDLKPVTFGTDAREVDALEGLAPPAEKPGGQVADRNPEDGTGIEAAPAADDLASQPPVDRAAALHVARADDQPGAGPGPPEHLGKVAGIVREVGVHLDEELVPVVEAAAEALLVGGAQPELAGAVKDPHAGLARGQLVEDLPGSVG
jgi:hypothetical protein